MQWKCWCTLSLIFDELSTIKLTFVAICKYANYVIEPMYCTYYSYIPAYSNIDNHNNDYVVFAWFNVQTVKFSYTCEINQLGNFMLRWSYIVFVILYWPQTAFIHNNNYYELAIFSERVPSCATIIPPDKRQNLEQAGLPSPWFGAHLGELRWLKSTKSSVSELTMGSRFDRSEKYSFQFSLKDL